MNLSWPRLNWMYWVLLGVGLVALTASLFKPTGMAGAVRLKLIGRAPHCSWSRLITMGRAHARFAEIRDSQSQSYSVQDFDPEFGIERISTPNRSFWTKRESGKNQGLDVVRSLIAEHQWMLEFNPDEAPSEGDWAIDCGAHVGTFADMALARGASKVIAIEPDPIHLECLRRNFDQEIAAGRVVLVPKAVWSEPGRMSLALANLGSAMNSLVRKFGNETMEVPVTTIDLLVAELGLERLDYLKMDIEGAERNALLGARDAIARFRPRLMIESNDFTDGVVEPAFVAGLNVGYTVTCGPCEVVYETPLAIIPYVLYYRQAAGMPGNQ